MGCGCKDKKGNPNELPKFNQDNTEGVWFERTEHNSEKTAVPKGKIPFERIVGVIVNSAEDKYQQETLWMATSGGEHLERPEAIMSVNQPTIVQVPVEVQVEVPAKPKSLIEAVHNLRDLIG